MAKGWKLIGTYSTRYNALQRSNLFRQSVKYKIVEGFRKLYTSSSGKKYTKPLSHAGGKKIKVFRLWAKVD